MRCVFILLWCCACLVAEELPQPGQPLAEQIPRQHFISGNKDLENSVRWLIAHDADAVTRHGRLLFQRAYSAADGASSPQQARVLSAQKPARLDFIPSCINCHNVPFGEPGAGMTVLRDAVTTRSTPHLFGAGRLDLLAHLIGQELTKKVDVNKDGIISRNEAQGKADLTIGDEQVVSFGSFDDKNGDGFPDLDPVVAVWFVDGSGQQKIGASFLHADVLGFHLAVRAFGASGPAHAAMGTTLRTAIVSAFALHAGMQAYDPILIGEKHQGGWAGFGAAGIRQQHVGALPDMGLQIDDRGLSLDDPDRDGVPAELTAGDIDVVEWFLSQQRQPSERHDHPNYQAGRSEFIAFGCSHCHIPNWHLGDMFLSGLYSDMRSHDVGTSFHERQADGSMTTHFRTTPLWGVAHSAPYGHDGQSLDLDAVIRRHGGEAAASQQQYSNASQQQKTLLLEFLRSLVLE